MMRTKAKMGGGLNGSSGAGSGRVNSGEEWEMRPGGMLVQKRNPDSDRNAAPPPPTIRVRVKHGSIYHEISISSTATFGDLKKMLTRPTGLHHQDQKLVYRDKEMDSKSFLDIVGVKDRSKIMLVEDPISQEKRLLEMRRNAKMEKASKSISEISLEIDKLAGQVSALDSINSKGGKVVEADVLALTELLMKQLLKLDVIVADGDVKLQRKMQVRRVQKYVETLDMVKINNSIMPHTAQVHSNGLKSASAPHHQQQRQQQHPPRRSSSGTVVTTKWETFDSAPPLIPIDSTFDSAPPSIPIDSTSSSTSIPSNNAVQPKFNWEFFE
ncbi:hypothetical protein SAY87_008227 [Trapa incisa]|uniref:BAG family molecular chaperone regulator 1 n=1 Tax=Trapa incisa TaxID=236973 RepID=A0AAN7KNJ5_9MYRT|nr:hypothetical protein SAY87_008227 [Trapa incisa]